MQVREAGVVSIEGYRYACFSWDEYGVPDGATQRHIVDRDLPRKNARANAWDGASESR